MKKFLLILTVCFFQNFLFAQTPPLIPANNVPPGCVLGGDGVIYKGVNKLGERNYSIPETNSRNVSNWSSLSSMPGFEGSGGNVYSSSSSGDSVLVCGDFTTVCGKKADGVALYSSSLNHWTTFPDQPLMPMLVALYNNEIYLCGYAQDTVYYKNEWILKFNSSLSKWDTVAGPIYTINGSVSINAMVVNSQNIFINAYNGFHFNGVIFNSGLIAINKITHQAFSLCDSMLIHYNDTTVYNGSTYQIAADNENLFVLGSFDQINTLPVTTLARLNLITMQWDSMSYNYGAQPSLIKIFNGDLYVQATTNGQNIHYRIFKWKKSNSIWSNTGFDLLGGNGNYYYDFDLDGSTIYIAGQRNDAQYYWHVDFRKYDLINHTLTNIDTISGGYFQHCNLLTDHSLFASGFFRTINGIDCGSIIKYTNNSYFDLGTGVSNSYVNVIVPYGNQYIIAGEFKYINNINYNNIALWDPVTNTYQALGAGVSGWVNDVDVVGDDIYIGGGFMYAGGIESHGIGKYNMTTHQWVSYGNHLDNWNIFSMTTMDNKIFVSGCFMVDYYDESLSAWLANQYNWGPSGMRVYKLLKKDSSILMLGSFDAVYNGGWMNMIDSCGGIIQYFPTTDSFKKINFPNNIYTYGFEYGLINGDDFYGVSTMKYTNSGLLWSTISHYSFISNQWNSLDTIAYSYCDAMVVSDSNLYIGGQLTKLNNDYSSLLVYNFNSAGWCHAGYHTNNEMQPDVKALCADGNKIYVGGNFVNPIPGLESPQFALFTESANNCFPDNYVAPSNSVIEIEKQEVLVYPNPTSDILNISFSINISGAISLCDLQGRIILTKKILGTENSISLKSISAGIYFVKTETADGIAIKKVVVTN